MASQGVRRRIFTANSRVHFQGRACGICGEQVELGQTYFRVILFYSVSFHSNSAHCSIIHIPSEDKRTCIQSVPVTISLSKPCICINGSDSYEHIRLTSKEKRCIVLYFISTFFEIKVFFTLLFEALVAPLNLLSVRE